MVKNRSSELEERSWTVDGEVVEVKVGVIGSDQVVLLSLKQRTAMINGVVWLFCAWPMARCIAMWLGFVLRSEVKMRFKFGHVVSDMTEKESIELRRIFVMIMLPRLVQKTAR